MAYLARSEYTVTNTQYNQIFFFGYLTMFTQGTQSMSLAVSALCSGVSISATEKAQLDGSRGPNHANQISVTIT